jgi:hypothetical protein
MTTRKKDVPPAIYQIKITLRGTRPPVWRRLLIPAELTLEQLHHVLQAAMGWQNCHLHESLIGRQRYGALDPDDSFMGGEGPIDERSGRLSEVFRKPGAKAEYTYDFGDNWEHAVIFEKILTPEAGLIYPLCIAGKLHGPPEDCGGIGGFYDFLETVGNPDHEEHEAMLEWFGGSFDPQSFSLDAVNRRLQPKLRPARKTAARQRVL